jgi:hypothetical protein
VDLFTITLVLLTLIIASPFVALAAWTVWCVVWMVQRSEDRRIIAQINNRKL